MEGWVVLFRVTVSFVHLTFHIRNALPTYHAQPKRKILKPVHTLVGISSSVFPESNDVQHRSKFCIFINT